MTHGYRAAMRIDRSAAGREARHILGLAWPVVLNSLNWTILHMIDVIVVGHAGTDQLGYLSAGRVLTFVAIVMGLSGMTGVLVFAARADGAGRAADTGRYMRAGILVGLLFGLPWMLVLLLAAEPLLRLFQVAPDLVDGGAAVARGMAPAFPFQFMLCGISLFLEGISRPRAVAAVNLAMLPLNAVLAWAWVGGHLGLPAMGAVGAVLATSTVSGFGFAAMLVAAWRIPGASARNVRDLSVAAWRAAWRDVPAIVRFGFVPAIGAGLELGGFAILMIMSTRLGEVTAAAFQVVFTLHNFAFAWALGFGSAVGVRAGNAVGEGCAAAAIPRAVIGCLMAALVMLAIGLAYHMAAGLLIPPFTGDSRVRDLALPMLLLLAPFMFLDGLQVVLIYALRSLGDQVVASVNSAFAFFFVTGGLGVALTATIGAMGLIWATIAGMAAAALLQGARLWRINARLATVPG